MKTFSYATVETQQLRFRLIENNFSDLNDLLKRVYIPVKPESADYVTCPKQGLDMKAVALHRVGFKAYYYPKQGHEFKRLAVPIYPNMGQVSLPPLPQGEERGVRR